MFRRLGKIEANGKSKTSYVSPSPPDPPERAQFSVTLLGGGARPRECAREDRPGGGRETRPATSARDDMGVHKLFHFCILRHTLIFTYEAHDILKKTHRRPVLSGEASPAFRFCHGPIEYNTQRETETIRTISYGKDAQHRTSPAAAVIKKTRAQGCTRQERRGEWFKWHWEPRRSGTTMKRHECGQQLTVEN